MPRRKYVDRRVRVPDAKYNSTVVSELINKIMLNGKKSLAEKIVYTAFDIIQEKEKVDPMTVLEQALKNSTPLLEVKARRVGGATYQVPVEVDADRGRAVAIRWLIKSSRARSGKSMAEKFAAELIDASKGQGATVKKREDTHKMAEANRAFAHYRW
ncbi:MAG: 30S ribosomal protein S7 [Dehalococcoidales bacterium]|jgi:small subunit ribosomal protein S7|nr:30S ribosomal protein S7 [Dehalococcoidales bacterium]